ncbi:ferrichrome ABC transporter, ferrichrome-binding protein [Calothrix sp. NIES-4071]|nr:ferrichrome ABC transporter, ferrichrome-binding protein [Calothrix sp. NIES-4071]BAZ58908.1 ferrichrome ABC transporter, ferrichrome-binding protein [Calothrix sp. NIES-4105]
MKKLLIYTLPLFLTINLSACTNNPQSQITQPTQKSQRVVTLTPLAADIIYNLDKTKLIGISNSRYTDTVAKSKFSNLPRVGKNTAINIEKIVALKPDLVVGAEGFHDKIITKLQELKIPTLVGNISSWQDLEDSTKQIAQQIGADPKPILDKYQSYTINIPNNGKTVLVLLRAQPTSSPNKNSWAGNLLEKFKYKNLAAELQGKSRIKGYITISQEKILEANPEKLFIIESANLNPNDFKQLPYWSKLKAVQNNQVYVFHHDGLITPTSIDTLEDVTKQLREVGTK